jgi:hypothetical protein
VLAGEIHLEQSVVTGGGAENRADLFGVYRKRDSFAFAAIENGWNFASLAEALGLVFASIGAGRSFYDDLCLSHAFVSFRENSHFIKIKSDRLKSVPLK